MAHSGPGFTGRQVWQRLMEGNMRFVQGLFQGRNLLDLRRTLAKGQQPEAAVLSCSDSRVPAEIIFDQSLGDLFVVRTAGLVLDPTSIGSLEYAVAHLHVPLLVIKGHEGCGAVTAAVEHPEATEGNIGSIIAANFPGGGPGVPERQQWPGPGGSRYGYPPRIFGRHLVPGQPHHPGSHRCPGAWRLWWPSIISMPAKVSP